MRELQLIGMGPGHPDQLTLQAISAIARTDVLFVVEKGGGTGELVELRTELLRRHHPGAPRQVMIEDPPRNRDPADGNGYRAAVADWHAARALAYERAFAACDPEAVGAMLIWGDPALYDSALRVIDAVRAHGAVDFELTVIPGITSVQALAAAHRIVLNGIGRPVQLTTGRNLTTGGWPGRPGEIDDVVVMLDGDLACAALDPTGIDIFWGANLGGPGERLVAGPLAQALPEIRRVRTSVKAERGWVMDTYLLRRTRSQG